MFFFSSLFSTVKYLLPFSWFGSLFSLGSFYFLVGSIRDYTGALFHDMALDNPVIKGLFYAGIVSFFFVVFYTEIFKLLGVTPSGFVHKIVMMSLPLIGLSLVGYVGYTQIQRHKDPVFMSLKNVTTRDELIVANHNNKVDHKGNEAKDKNYVFKVIKSGYTEVVYDDIFNHLGDLNRRLDGKSDGFTPLMCAVEQGNIPAVKALLKCSGVNLLLKAKYAPPGASSSWFWSYNVFVNTDYNAYKIGRYSGNNQAAALVRIEGERRGWPEWTEEAGKIGTGDATI